MLKVAGSRWNTWPRSNGLIGIDDPFLSEPAVDLEEEIDEADETNNVLVVNPDPHDYTGPMMPRGLPPLPDPGPGDDPLGGNGASPTFNVRGSGPLGGGTDLTAIRVNSISQDSQAPGLLSLNYQIQNRTKVPIELSNLSIFVAYDFGPEVDEGKGRRLLVYSSALAGDALGNKTLPRSVPGQGESDTIHQVIRIPRVFRDSQYKLIFVANAEVHHPGLVVLPGEAERGFAVTRLVFSHPNAIELGHIDPATLLQ